MADEKRVKQEKFELDVDASGVVKANEQVTASNAKVAQSFEATANSIDKSVDKITAKVKQIESSLAKAGGSKASIDRSDAIIAKYDKEMAAIMKIEKQLASVGQAMDKIEEKGRLAQVLQALSDGFSKMGYSMQLTKQLLKDANGQYRDLATQIVNTTKVQRDFLEMQGRARNAAGGGGGGGSGQWPPAGPEPLNIYQRPVRNYLTLDPNKGNSSGIFYDRTESLKKEAAAAEQLAKRYDAVHTAMAQLDADAARIQKQLDKGSINPTLANNALNSIKEQRKNLEEMEKSGKGAYQQTQVLTSGFLNMFQSVAAGQPIFTSVFVQSTQMIGAFRGLTVGMLAAGAAFGIGVAVAGRLAMTIAQVGDQANMARGRLAALVGSVGEARRLYASMQDLGATKTGISADETASVFGRFASGAQSMGATNDQALRLVESIQKLGQVSNATSQETIAGIRQIGQAFGSGVLAGDEMRSMLENLPVVADVIAAHIGVSRDALRKLGEQGKVTSKVMFDALSGAADDVDRKWNALPLTMERASGKLAASWQKFVVAIDDSLGLSKQLAAVIDGMAKVVNTAADLSKPTNPATRYADYNSEIALFEQQKERAGLMGANTSGVDRVINNLEGKKSGIQAEAMEAERFNLVMKQSQAVTAKYNEEKAKTARYSSTATEMLDREKGLTVEVKKQIEALTTIANSGAEAMNKYGISAGGAALLLDRLNMSLKGLKAEQAKAVNQAALLTIPSGYERDLAKFQQDNRDPSNPNSDADAKKVYDLQLRNSQKETLEADKERVKVLEKTVKLQGSINIYSQQQAQVEQEISRRKKAYGPGYDPTEDRKTLMREANLQAGAGAAAATQETLLQAKANERLAEAAKFGAAAIRAATYENRIAEAQARGNVSVAAVRKQNLAEEAQFVAEYYSKQSLDIKANTDASKARTEAIKLGGAQLVEATIAEQRRNDLLELGTGQLDKINKLEAARRELLKQQAAEQVAGDLKAQSDQYEQIALQLAYVGKNGTEASIALEKLKTQQAYRNRGQEAPQELLDAIEKNGRAQAALERQKSLFNEIANIGTQAFDRIGEAITEAYTKGEASALSFKSVTKGLISELIQGFLRLAVINPFKNWALGQNNASLWDLFSGGGGSAGAAGAAGGNSALSQASGMAQNYLTNKAGSYLMDKLVPGGIMNAIDKFGYSTLGIGTMAGTQGTMMTTAAGGLAQSAGVMPTLGGVSNAASAGSTTVGGITGGLSGYLGAGMAGAAGGGLVGGYLGTMTNSKAVGGLSGAAAGAGASALAAYMGFGAIGGPVGIAIGAIVGGIMGMLGTQKATVGPNGEARLGFNALGTNVRDVRTDNGGDEQLTNQLGSAVSQSVNTILANISGTWNNKGDVEYGSIRYMAKTGKYTTRVAGGQDEEFMSGEEAIANLMRKSLQLLISNGNLTGVNADVRTALTTSKASKAEDFANDIMFADGFRKQLEQMKAALDPTNNQIKEFTDSAKKIGEAVKTNITDWRNKANELKLATDAEMVPALRQAIEVMMGVRDSAEPLRGINAVVKQADIEFRQYEAALYSLGYTAGQVSDLFTQYVNKAVSNYTQLADNTRVQGQIKVNQAINENFRPDGYSYLRSLGMMDKDVNLSGLAGPLSQYVDKFMAGILKDADLQNMFNTASASLYAGNISGDIYNNVVDFITEMFTTSKSKAGEVGTTINKAVQDYLDKVDRQVDFARNLRNANASMYSRYAGLIGGNSGLIDMQLSHAQEQESLAGKGVDMNYLRMLQSVEQQQQGFEWARQNYISAIEQQMTALQSNTDALNNQIDPLIDLRRSLRDAAKNALTQESVYTSPYDRVTEARKQFDEAVQKFNDPNLSNASKQMYGQQIQNLGQTLIDASEKFYASSNKSDFDYVLNVWKSIGNVNEDQWEATQKQIELNDKQLKELQGMRSSAEQYGQRQYESLDALKNTMVSSKITLDGMLSTLKSTPPPVVNVTVNGTQVGTGGGTNIPPILSPRDQYLAAYRDVAADPVYGQNPEQHYALMGAYEGRNSFGMTLTREQMYLARYHDVALAVMEGRVSSGLEHYNVSGKNEGRVYRNGGVVGNGIYNADSVVARYAGGGNIFLAGGEYVMPASTTARYRKTLDTMRAGAWSEGANDNGLSRECAAVLLEINRTLQDILRVLIASGEATNANLVEISNTLDGLTTNRQLEDAA